MSSQNPVSPDTPITIKVNHANGIRRFKLPLRDLNANSFETRLRELLAIPANDNVEFERYSDSAGSWIKLDSNNVGVYRQLYRAAKAKLKLRIKANVVPAPESLIDAADTASIQTTETLLPSYSSVEVTQAPAEPASSVVTPEAIDDAVARAVNSHFSSQEFSEKLVQTVRVEVEKQTPPPPPAEPEIPTTNTMPIAEPSEVPPIDLEDGVIYSIYCNNCSNQIHALHYHCQDCENGDFDLCENCIGMGIHCNNDQHVLTARTFTEHGTTTTCEVLHGKTHIKKAEPVEPEKPVEPLCNSCCFATGIIKCKDCSNYDLCLSCFIDNMHGHDPRHEFMADGQVKLTTEERRMLKAGRDEPHNAICDGCDKDIRGIRHKCIDCRDFDYCSYCAIRYKSTHPGHRFLKVYGCHDLASLVEVSAPSIKAMHYGVYCDGPLCNRARQSTCIRGVRYKCAICPDTDFCGDCESSPKNGHNATHPLIKMKTPIRHVVVTTTDNNVGVMGDCVVPLVEQKLVNRPISIPTSVQTIADVKPAPVEFKTEAQPEVKPEVNVKTEVKEEVKYVNDNVEVESDDEIPALVKDKSSFELAKSDPLRATFISETVSDGTSFEVGQAFTQTWVMENTGTTSWPAGVTVTFAGGAYMFLRSDASTLNATITQQEVPVGGRCAFSVNLNATWPASRHYLSYWRLTTPDGTKFGDNIWCSINVVPEPTKAPSSTASVAGSVAAPSVKGASEMVDSFERISQASSSDHMRASHESDMIFPKLPVESPEHSVESLKNEPAQHQPNSSPISPVSTNRALALSDDGLEEIEFSSIGDSESYLTDEEYDVLDASDEEEFEEMERI
ncbi:hypothetical protein EX30DRAFT_342901 [Ascodesmis nigricans]|uniref:ZZ-type domain-containing protein n=1 Tax=Ascodesmis nigricans TaxID=341454 RepID=A0A4S2MP91_9PEZI|nr:hypothetical protein EX30DRAFT_342901 [Ascodesmis nigricans]